MKLSPDTLAALPAAVRRPGYDRTQLQPGIVHLGLGAFARAHLAPATDDAIEATGDLRWGITGVSLRHADVRDALAPQGGLYALGLRDAKTAQWRVPGCVLGVRVAPEDPDAVLEAIAGPHTRIVSLTVTEKGYCRDPATGALQWNHPDIVADLDAPRSALGCIVHGLARRRMRGLGGVTLLSLDNLPSNGHTLATLLHDLAGRIDASLPAWMAEHCTCPNSMVDRIVPRAVPADMTAARTALHVEDAAPVVAETFFDWAVEDRFVAGRPDWPHGGARFVAEAAPWEKLKLRMVNGAHSCIAYLGVLAGWDTVDRAIAHPSLARFVDALLRDEVQPTLPPLPGLDADAYRAALLMRFANPALAHRTLQIAMDGSQKLPQRLLGTVRDRIAAGRPVDRLALGIAAWLQHLHGRSESGEAFAIDDPLADALRWHVTEARTAPDEAAALTRFAPVFGDLADHPALVPPLSRALARLRRHGVRGALLA